MTQVYKYTIHEVDIIKNNGFEYKLDEQIVEIISNLTSEVGSPTYIKTPNFQKQIIEGDENKTNKYISKQSNNDEYNQNSHKNYNSMSRRRRGNKQSEHVKDDDWESIRTFNTTKIDQHEGIDVFIDKIRSDLNKMSVKTYDEINTNVMSIIDSLLGQNISTDEAIKISNIIFDIVSSNRFYSKLYANLYSNLLLKYDFIVTVFEEKFVAFADILNNVRYVSPDENYDLFCKINNENEKRKAVTAFFINLVFYDKVSISKIEELLIELLENVNNLIKEENKKFVVDEYIEIIFILYNKELFVGDSTNTTNINSNINPENHKKILDIIKHLAGVKVKTYPSLSSKSIFKLMDIVEL
jgi:hypothetical protein